MTELSRCGSLDFREILAVERSELLRFLHGLDSAEWSATTECPAWTVKGIALHLLGDDLSILSRQRDAEPSPVAIEAGSDWEGLFVALDRHNERWVEAAGYFSVPLLLEQLRLTGEQTHNWYATVDGDRLGEPIPWVGPEPAPYWLLGAREYLERWIHQCQIRRAVGRGEWFEARWVHPAVAVAVRGFPAGFAVLPAPAGTTVTVSIDDGPAWTLRKEELGWQLHDGAPVDPTVVVHLATSTAACLFSRAFRTEELGEHLRFEGDPDLGRTLVAGLAAFFGR